MKFYDVTTKRTYQKDGEQKVQWLKAGKLTVNADGKMYLTLFQQPETTFYVFEQKQETPMTGVLPARPDVAYPEGYPSPATEGVNPEDIPF